jgi:hypothetical protein
VEAEAHEVLSQLNQQAQFPKHGWARGANGGTYFVFPFIRAIWDWSETEAAKRLPVREQYKPYYFNDIFSKLRKVIEEIERLEALALRNMDLTNGSIDSILSLSYAQDHLPIWIDMFYIYTRILAERMMAPLRLIATNEPKSFPHEFKSLLKQASKGNIPIEWDMKGNNSEWTNVFNNKVEWYRVLRRDEYGKGGLRDTLVHDLVTQVVMTSWNDDGTKGISVKFESANNNAPDVDLFSNIRTIIEGLCEFLSSLPSEVWTNRTFQPRDLIIHVPAQDYPALTRFFPQIL